MFFLRNHLNFRVRILLKGAGKLGPICKEDLTSLANNYILAFLRVSVHIFFPRLAKSKKTITIVSKVLNYFSFFFRKNYFDYWKTKVLRPFRGGKKIQNFKPIQFTITVRQSEKGIDNKF